MFPSSVIPHLHASLEFDFIFIDFTLKVGKNQ